MLEVDSSPRLPHLPPSTASESEGLELDSLISEQINVYEGNCLKHDDSICEDPLPEHHLLGNAMLGDAPLGTRDLVPDDPFLKTCDLVFDDPFLAPRDSILGDPSLATRDSILGDPSLATRDITLGDPSLTTRDIILGDPSLELLAALEMGDPILGNLLDEIMNHGPLAFVAKQRDLGVDPAALMHSLGFSLPSISGWDSWDWVLRFLVGFIYQRPCQPIEAVEGVLRLIAAAPRILLVSASSSPLAESVAVPAGMRQMTWEEADSEEWYYNRDLAREIACDLLIVLGCEQAPLLANLLPPHCPQILINETACPDHPYDAQLIGPLSDTVSLLWGDTR